MTQGTGIGPLSCLSVVILGEDLLWHLPLLFLLSFPTGICVCYRDRMYHR